MPSFFAVFLPVYDGASVTKILPKNSSAIDFVAFWY